MRFEMMRRPGGDTERFPEDLWRWLYRTVEQLNLVMDRLDRAGTLAENAAADTTLGKLREASEQSGQNIGQLTRGQTALREDQTALSAALTAALGGKRVEVGRASISYGASASGAAVSFGKAFTNPPVVLAMQVFDSAPLTVHTDDITAAGFMARVKGGFASAGTREFGWVAIGE